MQRALRPAAAAANDAACIVRAPRGRRCRPSLPYRAYIRACARATRPGPPVCRTMAMLILGRICCLVAMVMVRTPGPGELVLKIGNGIIKSPKV